VSEDTSFGSSGKFRNREDFVRIVLAGQLSLSTGRTLAVSRCRRICNFEFACPASKEF
jgi:hypothetical protein